MRLAGPVLDSADPVALARFYSRLLGWEIARLEGPRAGNPSEDGWAMLRSSDGSSKLEFQWEPNYVAPTWPTVSGEQLMMMQLDFGLENLDQGEAWAIACGAVVADYQPQHDVRVMLDPEGHPFLPVSRQGVKPRRRRAWRTRDRGPIARSPDALKAPAFYTYSCLVCRDSDVSEYLVRYLMDRT